MLKSNDKVGSNLKSVAAFCCRRPFAGIKIFCQDLSIRFYSDIENLALWTMFFTIKVTSLPISLDIKPQLKLRSVTNA